MNPKEYLDLVRSKAYVGNPELAEEMFKYSANIVGEAMMGRSIKDLSTEAFYNLICTYWRLHYELSFRDCEELIKYCIKSWRDENLRVEYDEYYCELIYDGL